MRPAVIRAYALGIITGSMLTAGLSMLVAPARADVSDATVDRYSDAVCSVLAEFPSFDGIRGIGEALVEYGYSGYEAGEIIGASVLDTCPGFLPLIRRFAVTYGTSAHSKVA